MINNVEADRQTKNCNDTAREMAIKSLFCCTSCFFGGCMS